ncbi:WXG100 family type VII secretion target [Vallicoccus soli]|uniref:ESAT-6-like protein n=1 Tax=Vallicoccus soli TaxID=2339232 RepID=A0A3A3Z4B9_9ACTN|nr:WXG100 family type VII secretion target [Vallicoccus soli]RJK97778.1 WXG100 family type VII secretion target [Vallicoccus soli]
MTGFRVTPEQLHSLSGRVRGGAGSIDGELRGLAASVAPLGGDWAGVAQARFQELWAEWQRSAEGLNQALTGIADLLAQAGTAYAGAEEQVARSFG